MTDTLFFDTDCLSAFLWINNTSIIQQLYPGKIVIPRPVYDELSYPLTPQLKERVDTLLNTGDASIMSIDIGTDEGELYYQLTHTPPAGHKIIGAGEAASIALAKCNEGIVASNNLRDINDYIEEFSLKHMTTADIMVEAYQKGLIDENQGNVIWANMLKKKRRVGYASFSECLSDYTKRSS